MSALLKHSIKIDFNCGKENNLVWNTLEQVRPGDEVVSLKRVRQEQPHEFAFQKTEKGDYKVNKINPIDIPQKSSPDLMKYLGIYVGDGWVREGRPEVGFALPDGTMGREEFLNIHNRIFKSSLRQDKVYVYAHSINEYFDTEKVLEIKYAGIEPTLDLRVEGEHNFIADGIVVHNTGVQRSGLTPFSSATTTSPVGEKSFGNIRPKKPMPEIALAHGIPYMATCSTAFMQDIQRKVKKALSIKGPKYIQMHVPCPLGWRHEPEFTLQVAKLAVETGLYPIVEYENGVLISKRQIIPKPVEEYLKVQGRFKHLLTNPEAIKQIQDIADYNIQKYGLKAQVT